MFEFLFKVTDKLFDEMNWLIVHSLKAVQVVALKSKLLLRFSARKFNQLTFFCFCNSVFHFRML